MQAFILNQVATKWHNNKNQLLKVITSIKFHDECEVIQR